MAASYLTQQDGTSHVLLQDGSGALITAADPGAADVCSILTEDSDWLVTETGQDLILEECGATAADTGGNRLFQPARPRRAPSERRDLTFGRSRIVARAPAAKLNVTFRSQAAAVTVHSIAPQIFVGLTAVQARSGFRLDQPISQDRSKDIQDIVTVLEAIDHRADRPHPAAKRIPEA